ncbi:MAG: hypothetical protein AB7O96_06680 [Pseudobdellovibrionaceae bacterium]
MSILLIADVQAADLVTREQILAENNLVGELDLNSDSKLDLIVSSKSASTPYGEFVVSAYVNDDGKRYSTALEGTYSIGGVVDFRYDWRVGSYGLVTYIRNGDKLEPTNWEYNKEEKKFLKK